MSEDTTAMWRYAIGQRVRWAKDGQWMTITSRRWVERQILAPYAEYQVESPQVGTLWAVEADLFAPAALPATPESLVSSPLSLANDTGQMTHDPTGVSRWTWASVAPLLARWRMALIPHQDGTWDVLTGYDSRLRIRVFDARQVPWNQVPQTIMDLAARCEAAAGEEEA